MKEQLKELINWNDFEKIDIRVGTVVEAKYFEEAIKPAILMILDFGELGLKKTSAQITVNYQPEELIGKQVIAVVNFPSKQIANIQSECLVLGAVEGKTVTLINPDRKIKNGLKIS